MPDDRLEREINEILDKIEQFPTPESRRARARKRFFRRLANSVSEAQRAVVRQLARISISQVMLLSLALIAGAFFLKRANPMVMNWVLLAGVVLFVSSFAILVFTRGGGSSQTGYWRGREINYRSQPLSARLRRWLAERRRPRP